MGVLTSGAIAQTASLLNRVGLSGVNQFAKRVLRMVTRDTLRIQVDGLTIQGPVASSRILTQLTAESFEVFEIALFKESLAAGMVVVDVGANVGYYTLTAARIVGDQGQVFAFEPDPRTLTALRANVLANGFRNVTVIGKGASDIEGERDMYLASSANRSGLHLSASMDRIERRQRIETTTVDNVIGSLKADVVKMDIEGGEPAALRGMKHSLKHETVLFMEFNPEMLASAGTDADVFRELLLDQFASVEMLRGGRLVPFETVPERYTNLRCSGWRG